MKNILVIIYKYLGDTVIASSIVKALTPKYKVSILISKGYKDLFKGFAIENIFEIHKKASFKEIYYTINNIRRYKFDVALILNNSIKSALIPFLAGIPIRVGAPAGRVPFLTHISSYSRKRLEFENFKAVALTFDKSLKVNYPSLYVFEDEIEFVSRIFKRIRNYNYIVGIHPGRFKVEREWPADRFARLTQMICEQLQAGCLLFESIEQDSVAAYIRKKISVNLQNQIALVSAKNLRIIMAAISLCNLFVGSDSGPVHLAAALDVPVVTIFGPQTPVRFKPLHIKSKVLYKNFPCSPCTQKFFRECHPHENNKPACINAIHVKEVFNEINKLTKS